MTNIPQLVHQQLLRPHDMAPQRLVSGGLSAASVWLCADGQGKLACLRRWPSEHPTPSRLAVIHARLQELTASGIRVTPRVYCSGGGQTMVTAENHLWELTSWLPGAADYRQRPSRARLGAAVRALAEVHHIWSRSGRLGISPTVEDRLQRLHQAEQWLPQQAELHASCASERGRRLVAATCDRLRSAAAELRQGLHHLSRLPVQIHFVQRDIWSDHVLFEGEQLTGIIDFGAAREDDPLTDLVRLLSTSEPNRSAELHWGWQAYLDARGQLGDGARVTASDATWSWERYRVLDHAATLLSAVQWMEWVVIQPRDFRVPSDTLMARWEAFLHRLKSPENPWS